MRSRRRTDIGTPFRAPRESTAQRRVLCAGSCPCGEVVEFVAGCGWLAVGSWEPCPCGQSGRKA